MDGWLQLAGKTAVVTGAASGIGRAAALAFAEAGTRVVAADRAAEAGARVAAELAGGAAAGHRFEAVDVTDPDSVRRLFAAAPAPVDILVNNAGINPARSAAGGGRGQRGPDPGGKSDRHDPVARRRRRPAWWRPAAG